MNNLRITFFSTIIFLAMSMPAYARSSHYVITTNDIEVDASLVTASSPASGFDSATGIAFGAGMLLPQVNKDLQARVEFSYFSWSTSQRGVNINYNRFPIAFGGRFFLPSQNITLKLYAQGMLEISFDSAETVDPGLAKKSHGNTHLGIVPGAGIEYRINPNLGLVSDVRMHLITDGYYTVQVGLAYHF